MKYIELHDFVSPHEFFNRIKGYCDSEKDLFMAFTEPCDNFITLSPLAFCLLEAEGVKAAPMIGNKACKQLDKITGQSKTAIKRLISNSAQPLWRGQHIHRWAGTTDLLILKSASTAERAAGFIKGNKFYIALVFGDHDDYERVLASFQVKDFADETFKMWEGDGS